MSLSVPPLEQVRAAVDPRIDQLAPLASGMFSTAFACEIAGQPLVLRLNRYPDDFAKDAWAWARLRGPTLPIPRILRHAPFDATHWYALSERCTGQPLGALDAAGLAGYAPALLAALAAIWSHNTSAWRGWGLTNPAGHGLSASWAAHLLAFHNQKFDYRWGQIDQPPLLDLALIQRGIAAVQALVPLLPTERWLIHGDFGPHNLVGQPGQLSGVLDWAEARLGDWVYDLAGLDFWLEAPYFCRTWLAHSPTLPPHFWERVRCYGLVAAIHTISIAALLNQRADLAWGTRRLEQLLAHPAEPMYRSA